MPTIEDIVAIEVSHIRRMAERERRVDYYPDWETIVVDECGLAVAVRDGETFDSEIEMYSECVCG